MSEIDELKWKNRKWSWQYIPDRYQAMVAIIASAFLYLNVFKILFTPVTTGSGACGTLLRPVIKGTEEPTWIWFTGPFSVNENLVCPRHNYLTWWEFFASFVAIAVCGLILRRVIRREHQAERLAALRANLDKP